MAKDLLLEIGMEELPARFIRDAVNQFADKMTRFLQDSRIEFTEVKTYATPRRLAVLISNLAEKGSDVTEQVKGPSRKIALDEQGNWSKAALGFARSQGVDPQQFFFQELQGVEYIYAEKNLQGADTAALLSESLPGLITSLSFPKNMRWGAKELKYVRPIRSLVALFGKEVIPFELAGVSSDRISRGHRFLGKETSISEASAYKETLREQYVLVDIEERKQLIVDGIKAFEQSQGWNIPMQADLLEEVIFLVEYPTALYGTFNPEFLNIPKEVLITSMREHQRYFPVLDADGNLKPFFVTVRNGNDVSLDVVAKGNEKVLRARLSDAKFFYQEDQKHEIAHFLERLETIVFQEELGTIGDKVRRIVRIADSLAKKLQTESSVMADVERAATICKFDLVTQMVYEFPELQGIMGEDYARKAGEKETVAKAINEHYMPRYSGDASPASLVGTIVSIADKLDTIAGCFAIGIIPTGSQDPYALRRQAAGIVQMVLDHKLSITLPELFDLALHVLQDANLAKRKLEEIKSDMNDFFGLRVKNVLTERGIRYDVIDAVMGAGYGNIVAVVSKSEVLMSAVAEPEFKTSVESFNRANNLAGKADGNDQVNPTVFTEQVEHQLYEEWQAVRGIYAAKLCEGEMQQALATLTGLQGAITAFFDGVMVMAEDEAVRRNRLALLSGISSDCVQFADFHKLVW